MIVIKNPEKLAEQPRPMLIYNVLEWINTNMGVHSKNKQNSHDLTFVLISRDVRFFDNSEKRVKSRMNIPLLFLPRSKPAKIKELILKRID